jgi:hypothetical protein
MTFDATKIIQHRFWVFFLYEVCKRLFLEEVCKRLALQVFQRFPKRDISLEGSLIHKMLRCPSYYLVKISYKIHAKSQNIVKMGH